MFLGLIPGACCAICGFDLYIFLFFSPPCLQWPNLFPSRTNLRARTSRRKRGTLSTAIDARSPDTARAL